MQTTFDQYLEFPCAFNFRVMGLAEASLPDRVVAAIQAIVPGDYIPSHKPSRNGTYWSVSVTAQVPDKATVETIYRALGQLDGVRMVL